MRWSRSFTYRKLKTYQDIRCIPTKYKTQVQDGISRTGACRWRGRGWEWGRPPPGAPPGSSRTAPLKHRKNRWRKLVERAPPANKNTGGEEPTRAYDIFALTVKWTNLQHNLFNLYVTNFFLQIINKKSWSKSRSTMGFRTQQLRKNVGIANLSYAYLLVTWCAEIKNKKTELILY